MGKLSGKKVAILTENGFEEEELTSPKKALEEAGATVHIVSPQKDKVKAWAHDHWSIELPVDKHISEVKFDDYDGLVLPGGVMNPDSLRGNKESVDFAQQFLVAAVALVGQRAFDLLLGDEAFFQEQVADADRRPRVRSCLRPRR